MKLSARLLLRAVARSRSTLGQQIADDIERYSQLQPTALTLQNYIDFGKSKNELNSLDYLMKELPVRFSNIMREFYLLPPQLLETSSVRTLQGWYEQSFFELMQMKRLPLNDEKSIDKINDGLDFIRNRHTTVVETMAEGILELKAQQQHNNNKLLQQQQQQQEEDLDIRDVSSPVDARIQYFLDRFYMSRIGLNTILGQHLGIFSKKKKITIDGYVGEIQLKCGVKSVAEDAFDNARFLCEQYYSDCPDCEFICSDETTKGLLVDDVYMSYIPSHLYHMIFEIIKNSLRAVVECHGGKGEGQLPKVKVLISKGSQDVTIRISDRGGGIKRSQLKRLFNYMYSTAPRPDCEGQTPLAGYGYGLPLSKIYARYFGGNLSLFSVDGYGSDATICLKSNPAEAYEVLPVFNRATSQKYTQATQIQDWSSNPIVR
ncbi:hypothetical protein HELRODRAFT_111666 [Helobdella robusta]|uniref:Protein-serine/threonine kinase n=1 Tax=Helobdella robusta TaxID=6412 RepID=T1EFD5_HELRO|nr:hypothetical protein HELRODRAFT_111666 [Helobdella robusta]ESO04658.1 hypothetical protein HELRODRAFT_111666 [Helobdella robusta]